MLTQAYQLQITTHQPVRLPAISINLRIICTHIHELPRDLSRGLRDSPDYFRVLTPRYWNYQQKHDDLKAVKLEVLTPRYWNYQGLKS